jgi:hypothetical protein
MITDANTHGTATGPEEVTRLDSFLVGVDSLPWSGVYRTTIGFVMLPAVSQLWGENSPAWALAAFFLGVLLLLRVVPAMIRRLVPFSGSVQEVWAQRRRLAKRYDSYQWQKLFWIGVGMASYMVLSGQFRPSRMIIPSICLLSGALGLARWRVVAVQIDSMRAPAKKVRGPE